MNLTRIIQEVKLDEIYNLATMSHVQVSFETPANTNNEVRNTHINIGTGKEISIKDLATKIKESTGFNGNLIFDISKPDGTMRKLTDPSKLHSLGWHHKIELDEGVKKLYDWYLSN